MVSKSAVNAVCLLLLPFFVVLSGYYLFTGHFFYSLVALIGVLICVRMRLFMGYRGVRGTLFRTHLCFSISLLILLLILWLTTDHMWLIPVAEAVFVGMALTGIVLVKKSWHRLY